jgi:hypothetical protein
MLRTHARLTAMLFPFRTPEVFRSELFMREGLLHDAIRIRGLLQDLVLYARVARADRSFDE